MSYDVVALVGRFPDERAIVHALEGVDPELLLHWHADTNLLQIRDRAGHLLATIEPGQRVGHPDEVVRLLDPDIVAGLPETFWWVEVRARPDGQGREVAHRFGDGLALRLGGAVWTSGTADFDLWKGSEHPAVERAADRSVLVAQDRRVVPFSSWIGDAIATHTGQKMLQVLTPSTARLTYGMRTFLAGPLGRWVVRGQDGDHFDGLTGLAVRWDDVHGFLPDQEPSGLHWAVGKPGAEPVQGFLTDFPETTGTQVVVDVSVLQQDPLVPRVGQAAQVVAEHLAKAAPRAWGPHEPTLRAWDREQMVAFAHRRKPRACVLYLSGPQGRGHPFSGQIRLSWRGSQVLEQVSVVVGFQDEDAITPEVFPVLVEALASAGLVEALRVRRIPGRVDVTYVPVWAGPAIPVGLAIGPERLRRIGVGPARSGPIAGTLVGGGEHRAVWYPVLRDAASPLRALDLVQRQTAHMAAVSRR